MNIRSTTTTKTECHSCKKKLSGKTVRLPDGSAKYHWHCLQCKGCGLPFEDPSFYIDPFKHIYHPQCAPSIQTCSRCSQAIADTYLHYNTQILHPRCFRCTGCQKILHPTSIYTDFQGPYCQTCTHEKLDQDKQVLSDHLKIVPSPISKNHEMVASPVTPLSPLTQIPENVKPSTLMSSRGRPLPKFGLVRDCAGCHERIVSVHEEIPGPKASKWHKKCLVCQGCLKSLDSGASVDEEEGKLKPWCTTCLLTRKKRMATSLSQRLTTLKIN
ncbi:Four and a half LIM domains protein 3 [Choanephora cucurbitarum]|uniref:Four and a half LIM domains protein 3 n=1 Tax=Choanephora cucurbitarum TaxID=101091 RepID=A0A1C7NRP8_9FUNG|nr:Four and a half LIM domains protein 3 [Choanephora cucurbitarum]